MMEKSERRVIESTIKTLEGRAEALKKLLKKDDESKKRKNYGKPRKMKVTAAPKKDMAGTGQFIQKNGRWYDQVNKRFLRKDEVIKRNL